MKLVNGLCIGLFIISLSSCQQVPSHSETEPSMGTFEFNITNTTYVEIFDLKNPQEVQEFIEKFPEFTEKIRIAAEKAQATSNELTVQAMPYCDTTAAVITSWWSGNKHGRARLSCNTAFIEAEVGAEIFNLVHFDGDMKGKTCWYGSSCTRDTSGIPSYPDGYYCAYANTVVFGGTWGGAGGAMSSPGC